MLDDFNHIVLWCNRGTDNWVTDPLRKNMARFAHGVLSKVISEAWRWPCQEPYSAQPELAGEAHDGGQGKRAFDSATSQKERYA